MFYFLHFKVWNLDSLKKKNSKKDRFLAFSYCVSQKIKVEKTLNRKTKI